MYAQPRRHAWPAFVVAAVLGAHAAIAAAVHAPNHAETDPAQPPIPGRAVTPSQNAAPASNAAPPESKPAPATAALPPLTGSRQAPVASWGKPLPYPIVVADRRNNRLVEITPDKRVVWEFTSPNLKVYRGNDDVNFSPDGKLLAVSEEDNFDIHLVDYEQRALLWTFGVPDVKGRKPGFLNYPDDAHVLTDGTIMTADIRNCRVLFIERETSRILNQWGEAGRCRHDPPHSLDLPNGATPLENGDILITEIRGPYVSRITREGKVVWSVKTPWVMYPSDAFPTMDGQIIVADFSKPGKIVIFDPAKKKPTWEYKVTSGDGLLDHPSLARELPTGDVLVTDDLRHRVVVIDRQTKQIVWQYGETDRAGNGPGQLHYPDGFDLDVFRDWRGTTAR